MQNIDIRHILCPIDLSECSQMALAHAVALAKWYRARITVLHVFQFFVPPHLLPADPGPMIVPYPSRASLTADVTRFVEPLKDANVPVQIIVEDGQVAARIVETAARLTADLVVIGTHGLGGVDHLMLGSVAEKVLRKSVCPVLVVPPGAHLGVRVKRILCPVDFSSSSTAALRLACSIAKEADARISILHVLEWSAADSESLLEDLEVYTLWEERVRRRLEALLTDEDRTWCEPVPTLDSGKPYRKILEVARRENTDLIVMGVAGRGALDLLFFGSTTNHVVRQAPCPVLTLRTTSRGENGGYERMPETRRMASPTS